MAVGEQRNNLVKARDKMHDPLAAIGGCAKHACRSSHQREGRLAHQFALHKKQISPRIKADDTDLQIKDFY